MIQLRNVPDALHRRLKARAALAGRSLSDYLLREIEDAAATPTVDEWLIELEHDAPVQMSTPVADVLREVRGEREGDLSARKRRPQIRAKKR